jgi:parvulin-like peptidyl-prolyl isomerase
VAKKKPASKPRELTRRQRSSHARARRRQRFVLFGGIGVIVIIVVLVLVGVLRGLVLPMNATVLKINDREFDLHYYIAALEQLASSYPDQNLSTLSEQVLGQIQNVELLRQGAARLGVTVSDDELSAELEKRGLADTTLLRDLVRSDMLKTKLKEGYFADQVEDPAPQVDIEGLLLEDESVAEQVRALVVATDNITGIVEEYGLNYYSQNAPYGSFGWHPRDILNKYFDSEVPLDWAFAAPAGEVSPPLADNTTSKKLGYWVLRVNSRDVPPETDNVTPVTANVTGLLLGSRAEALDIKDRLEAGEDVAALAEEYSQYTQSQQYGGQLALLTKPAEGAAAAVSPAVDEIVFDPDTPIGAWLGPVKDDDFYTTGGDWIIRVVDTSPSRPLSDDDRSALIDDAFTAWANTLTSDTSFVVTQSLTTEQQALAIKEATKDLGR